MSEPAFEALRAVFDQLSLAVIILSAGGQILFANRKANAMLEAGWPVRLLDGCLHGDRSAGAALKQAIELASSCPESAAPCHFEVCLAQASAERPAVLATLRRLTWDGAENRQSRSL